jgi:hypothetical protein
MLTHISTLPSLHTLRLCNRFGHGRFHDFPVELIKMVEGYVAKPVRERVATNLAVASRCFKNDCSLIDHADREMPLDLYREGVEAFELDYYSRKPNDKQLLRVVREYYEPLAHTGIDEEEAHHRKRVLWPETVGRIFSPTNRAMFSKKFGLDIWFSFVRLADDGRLHEILGVPQATITYLTLPGSVTRQHKWDGNAHFEDLRGYDHII